MPTPIFYLGGRHIFRPVKDSAATAFSVVSAYVYTEAYRAVTDSPATATFKIFSAGIFGPFNRATVPEPMQGVGFAVQAATIFVRIDRAIAESAQGVAMGIYSAYVWTEVQRATAPEPAQGVGFSIHSATV